MWKRMQRCAVGAALAGLVLAGGSACNNGEDVVSLEGLAPVSPVADGKLPWRGADISFTQQEERAGNPVKDAGKELPMERLLAQNGANLVRLRVWVDPPKGYSDEASTLDMARRVKAAGMQVLLDVHYSDFWASPTVQEIPEAWQGLGFEQLRVAVHDYSRDLVAHLVAQGTPPAMVQVGNEIGHGMLWPVGDIRKGDDASWQRFGLLLQSAIAGVREGGGATPPKIVIQSATATIASEIGDLVQRLTDHGVAFDIIGLSYYPFWQGPLSKVASTLDEVATRFDKDILLVETGYPWTLKNADKMPNKVVRRSALPEVDLYPPTPAGQAAFFEALRDLLSAVPGNHGLGFVVWEPGWMAGVGTVPGAGTEYDNLTFVDHHGNALPALRSLRP